MAKKLHILLLSERYALIGSAEFDVFLKLSQKSCYVQKFLRHILKE